MSVITYVAKDRVLKSGHTAGTTYQIEFNARRPPFDVDSKQTNTALDGSAESLLYNVVTRYDITTKSAITSSSIDDWREFFASVAAREVFQLDLTGTIASPVADINVVLVGGIPKPQLLDPKQLYSFAFTVQTI